MKTEAEIEFIELTPEQEARSKIRQVFLNAIHDLIGKPCKVLTYENSLLEAKFCGWKPNGSALLVRDLKTPANIQMESAMLRTCDILALKF